MESKKRSIAKSITWRIFSFLTLTTIILVITRDPRIALGVGLAEAVGKTIIYYMHERWWSDVEWGRTKQENENDNKGSN